MSFIKKGNDATCKIVGIIKTSEDLSDEEKKLAAEAVDKLNKASKEKNNVI